MRTVLILACALVWQVGVQAQAPAPAPEPTTDPQLVAAADGVPAQIEAERMRLQRERTAIEQAHENDRRACWQRFAVNDCLRDVRRSLRKALEPLRARELVLNAQERAWRTEQREERLQEKRDAQERRP